MRIKYGAISRLELAEGVTMPKGKVRLNRKVKGQAVTMFYLSIIWPCSESCRRRGMSRLVIRMCAVERGHKGGHLVTKEVSSTLLQSLSSSLT